MKRVLLFIAIGLLSYNCYAQNIGIGTPTPNASAKLEVTSTTAGFLPPRMTFAQRNAIPNPAQGLIIYCTDCTPNGQLQNFDGVNWQSMVSGLAIPVLATISTTAATSITTSSAISGGNITSDGGAMITRRGFIVQVLY